MNVIDYIQRFPIASRERHHFGKASRSEMKRWCEKGCVDINGVKVKTTDRVQFPIKRLVFFPDNSRQRVTLWEEVMAQASGL